MCDVIDLADELNANLNVASSISKTIIKCDDVPIEVKGSLTAVIQYVEQSRQLSNQLAESAA